MFKSEKNTPQCKNPASLPPDWRGFNHCYEMCQRQPLRISRPVVTLAVSMTLFNDNKKSSNKLNYIKFSGTDPTSPLHPSLPSRSRPIQFLVDSVGQCTSNAEVDPLLQHMLQCLPGAIAEHLIINTTNRYNRKFRLAVFVFVWVNCRVFENLMGTQVKPLDCAWAHKTPPQPVTPFYSLSLSSWAQDTVHPC